MNFYRKRRASWNVNYDKIPFLVFFVVMLYTFNFCKFKMDGDDYWFKHVTKDYSLINYLKLRYATWTGRINSETIFYYIFRDNGLLWRILTPLFIVLSLYCISRIVLGKKKDDKNFLINCYICVFSLFISKSIIFESIFWMTGSVVYLWGISFALISIIPFRDALMKEYSEKLRLLYIICGIAASMFEEQISLVIAAFAVIINIDIYIKDRKIYKNLIIENIFMLFGLIISFAAPGNFVRKYKETINWMPNYPLYSKSEVIVYGIQWILNNLLNNLKVILFLLFLLMCILFYIKNKKTKKSLLIISPVAAGCLLTGSAILLNIDSEIINKVIKHIKFPHAYFFLQNKLRMIFFDFDISDIFILRKLTIIKFILWSVIILIVPYTIWYLYDFKRNGFYVALLYIAGICSAAVMFVSPTMNASGLRTFFVFMVLLLIIIIFLLKDCKCLLNKKAFSIFFAFAVFKYIYILFL